MTASQPTSRHFRATVLLAIAMLTVLALLALLFPSRVDHAGSLLRNSAIALVLVGLVATFSGRLPARLRVAVRAGGGIAMVSFLFGAISGVQHLIFAGWFDDALIRFETTFTGIELSHWLEQFIHPALTEWMM
ncbi:MAG: hypothetical protein IH600_18170, partial [Bacteroidetes bacterium]|nr:hypothetical protein [Bacteroidota bacterium]